MNFEFNMKLEKLIEKHLPVGFLEYETLSQFQKMIFERESMGRKEILILAYIIGANAIESDELLRLAGHPSLYVKKREDAIWKYSLNNHTDSASIIENIFLQNLDENKD